ncbi:MAG: imidazole glycerol phosphate synthase subunit HisF [Gemmatimonadetes bacterium]|nr:imidazole glycerol phosphate synthase subunit HisF [Gemmatimonadota bacterium]
MLRKRIIVCLDVQNGRVVKGINFEALRDVGDPVELAQRYEAEGADEIVFLDISASAEGRRTLLDTVRRTAENLFVPLTVGGGINDVSDVGLALRAGADKVSINTAAVTRPDLIGEAAHHFGSQCIVASIDARLERRQVEMITHSDGPAAPTGAEDSATWYRVFTHGGRNATDLDAIEWAVRCAQLGAGEILITSIDQDGRRAGYDLELTARIGEAVTIPVIASGGAGTSEHVRDVFLLAGADAALVAGILHDGATTVGALKQYLAESGIDIRQGPVEMPQP